MNRKIIIVSIVVFIMFLCIIAFFGLKNYYANNSQKKIKESESITVIEKDDGYTATTDDTVIEESTVGETTVVESVVEESTVE